jgi:1,4-dihydroxy-6-naphthoate synthase
MLTLAFSPCPNDTFIFDAIVNKRVDCEGIDFIPEMHDVEHLNQMAIAGKADVIKVSYFTYLMLKPHYVLLDSGSAMGFGNGPLLISRDEIDINSLKNKTVAIPGKYTTAHMLYRLAVPETGHREFMLFSDIEQALLDGRVDAGVIIHENRFTYQQKGLRLMMDLGAFWEQRTGSPIPLGGIIARRDLGYDTINSLNRIMFRSVEFAMKHPEEAMPFVRRNAQEMDEEVMKKHIALYVNENTLSLGTRGRISIAQLASLVRESGLTEP